MNTPAGAREERRTPGGRHMVACAWPGGCTRWAYAPSVHCEMHQRQLETQTEALERLAGAVRDFLWEMDSRRRRSMNRPGTKSPVTTGLRHQLSFAEYALREKGDPRDE